MPRVELLQEWFLEGPLSNFSEKLLLKHRLHFQDAQERITSRRSFNISILNPIPGGGNHLVIMKTRPWLCYADSNGFIKLQLPVLSPLTT